MSPSSRETNSEQFRFDMELISLTFSVVYSVVELRVSVVNMTIYC